MQKIIQQFIVACLLGGLLQTNTLCAQDQIMIRKKKDSKEKVTIVVDGDKITVNGKPIDDFKNDDIEISQIEFPELAALDFDLNKRHFEQMEKLQELQHFDGDFGQNWAQAGKRNEAFLGVLTEATDDGAKITKVTDESPAYMAALKEADYITKVNEIDIKGPDDLYEAIGKFKPEDKVSITFTRDGKTQKKDIILAKNKDVKVYGWNNDNNYSFNFRPPSLGGGAFSFTRKPRMGAIVQDTEDNSGVNILEMDDDTPAAKAGLKIGDIITMVNDTTITSTDDIRNVFKDAKDGDSYSIKYKRDNQTLSTTLRFPKELKTIGL